MAKEAEEQSNHATYNNLTCASTEPIEAEQRRAMLAAAMRWSFMMIISDGRKNCKSLLIETIAVGVERIQSMIYG